MTDEVNHLPQSSPGWTVPDESASKDTSGLNRRTVVLGAAWAVPVISAAIATPLAAASTEELTLTFDGPYSAVACGPLDDITVSVARNGSPAPGEPVTVTLPTGVTWSDGSTAPRVMTSDASGNVVLSGLIAPNSNGTFNFIGQSGAATATTQLTTVGADRGVISTFGGGFLPSLPAGVLIEDMQANTAPNGASYVIVRGSDGHAYVSTSTSVGAPWSSWTQTTTPLTGSIIDLAVNQQGISNVVASSTQVSFLAGGVSSALPGGATITDVQSYTQNGNTVAVVLGSDGRAYRSIYANNAWGAWTPTTTVTSATHIAVSETGGGAIVANTTNVAPIAGGTASPTLPGGATIEDVQMAVNANGVYTILARSAGNTAHTITYTPSTGAWGTWNTATSTLNGSIEQIALSHAGGNAVLASGNQVSLYGNGPVTAPLPNGASVTDIESTTVNGVIIASVLGSDGRAYQSTFRNGAWTPWNTSRVGQSNLEYIALTEVGSATLVASNPLC